MNSALYSAVVRKLIRKKKSSWLKINMGRVDNTYLKKKHLTGIDNVCNIKEVLKSATCKLLACDILRGA